MKCCSAVGRACDLLESLVSPCLPFLENPAFRFLDVGMGQYLLIPFLVGWTSIYQLFWCSPGVPGFDPLPDVSNRAVPSKQLSSAHFRDGLEACHTSNPNCLMGTPKSKDVPTKEETQPTRVEGSTASLKFRKFDDFCLWHPFFVGEVPSFLSSLPTRETAAVNDWKASRRIEKNHLQIDDHWKSFQLVIIYKYANMLHLYVIISIC